MATIYVTSTKTVELELIGPTGPTDDDAINVHALREFVQSLNKHSVPGSERVTLGVGAHGGTVLKVRYSMTFGCPAGDEELALHRLDQMHRADEDRLRTAPGTTNGTG
jgi:hypothetical protein